MIIENDFESLENFTADVAFKILRSEKNAFFAHNETDEYLNNQQINELTEVIENWLKENEVSKKKDKSLYQLTMLVFPLAEK